MRKGEVKYQYAYDENGNRICIRDLSANTKHDHTYTCINCGNKMIANIGKVKQAYFSHAVDCNCSGESYFHKLAKMLIKEKFDNDESFPLIFNAEVPCREYDNCISFYKEMCSSIVSKEFDLKKCDDKLLYDTCEEEVEIDNFRPDLLLSLSTNPNQPKILIEVLKTHKSTHEKIDSKLRIIETKKIASEDDIEDIIQNGFIEGKNCSCYNFKHKFLAPPRENIFISRFIYFRDDSILFYPAISSKISCNKINEKIRHDSLYELNLNVWHETGLINGVRIREEELGLVYLLAKGMDVKNCLLCKHFRYGYGSERYVKQCAMYIKLHLDSNTPNPRTAHSCPQYSINPSFQKYTIDVLKKYVSEV